MLLIESVEDGSAAFSAGLESGDRILKFNKTEADYLSFLFFESEEKFTVLYEREGREKYADIKKSGEESLGLSFKNAEMTPMRCNNKCVFCFVDNLPKGLRQSLYFKDDDYRFSFMSGCFVTLTNISESDIEKIITCRLSPLYISVHATDGEVRKSLLKNKNADRVLDIIERLSKAGIEMHCQAVICPGVNDEDVLRKTINDLYRFRPAVKSLAVVPAGITKYSKGILQTDKQQAESLIKICGEFDASFVFLADEAFLKAEKELPAFKSYGAFSQLENGVGLIRKFEREFFDVFEKGLPCRLNKLLIITGQSAFPFIGGLVEKFKKEYTKADIEVFGIESKFFGETVTVSGLLTGSDIITAFKGREKNGKVIIPSNMLKRGGDLFLDGYTVSDLEKELGIEVKVCGNTGYEFFDMLIEGGEI